MTEARESTFGSQGLFATKAYASGDVILKENPLAILLPKSDDESKSFMMELIGDKKKAKNNKKKGGNGNATEEEATTTTTTTTLWNSIEPPSAVEKKFHGTFRGMVQVGLCFMKQSPISDQESLLSLYYPAAGKASTLEQGVLEISAQAVQYLKSNKPTAYAPFKDWETLEKVMLIWVCNSFQGGRIYSKISRSNHDCNPNAIIQPVVDDGDAQKLVAAADIKVGDEITISYLGLLLYAEAAIRQDWLRKSKFFDCQCTRCSSNDDKAARFPCPSCHPRQLPQQSLDEDVQYDDDQNVHYTTWKTPCSSCQKTPETDGTNKFKTVTTTVTKKIGSFLDSFEGKSSSNDDDDEDDDEILEEHVSLASTILGDKHWTTNLLMLLHLDRRLSSMSQRMLTTQELPEMEDVAEAIDSLQRICRFVESLELKLDMGHILNDVVIGVARMLVSMGDTKSQKYGAEWLDKIADYVDKFESEGRKKVVTALQVAWKKSSGGGDDGPASKKAKTS